MKSKFHFLLCLLVLQSTILFSQLRSPRSATPFPYFDDYKDGYVVLRDGNRIDGNISMKDFEKDDNIIITDKQGNKYSIDPQSLKDFGLNMQLPVSVSQLDYYEWNNLKKRENKDPERGFVTLTSGETKTGKIKIEGSSSDSYLAGKNYFALDKLTFYDKDGTKTEYKKEQVKEYGKIFPWAFAPYSSFAWNSSMAFGRRKTKAMNGYVITNDGRRVEGNMKLSAMTINDNRGGYINGPVVEIIFEREGKDEKIDIDDVFAFGLTGATINSLTNNMSTSYVNEEMNFHPGSVTTSDGKKREGLVAYFPTAGNYYGVYFATKPDEPVTIIAMKDITDVQQDISLVEAFDDGTAEKTTNTNINGYVIGLDGNKYEGTLALIDDHGFWCRGIDFTNKDNKKQKFGGNDAGMAYAMVNGNVYVEHDRFLMKAVKNSYPLILFNNPHPDNTSMLDKMIQKEKDEQKAQQMGWLFRNTVGALAYSGGVNGSNARGVGKTMNDINNVGRSVAEGIAKDRAAKEKLKDPYPCTKKSGDYFILDMSTGEITPANDFCWNLLFESCKNYLEMSEKTQKEIKRSSDIEQLDFVNAAYSARGNKGF